MKGFVKDPDATLDYQFDWGPWLVSDTIATSTWISDSGLTIVPASDSFTDTTTTVFVSGGAAGEKYTLKNHITTAGSRIDDRSILIQIRER